MSIYDGLHFLKEEEREKTDLGQIEELKLSQQYASLFASEAGMKVLADLKAWTVDATTWVPGMGHDRGYFREGQNAIVRYIQDRINHAKQ